MKNETGGLLVFPVGRKLMGVTIAYLLGVWSSSVFAPDWHVSALISAAFLFFFACKKRCRKEAYAMILLCLLAVGNAVSAGCMSVSDSPTQPNTVFSGVITRIERDYRVELSDVEFSDGHETHRPVVVTLMTEENAPMPEMPKIGQRVSGEGRLFAPDEVRNPGGTDGRIRALAEGYELSGYLLPGWMAEGKARFSLAEWFRQQRQSLLKKIQLTFGNSAPLFAAVMIGEKNEIDAEMTAAMRLTGIAHILSVSGMHLNLVSAAAYAMMRLLPLGKRVKRGLRIAVLVMFTGLTGCAVGTKRALIMALMRMYSKARGLRYDRLTALSFAALAITVFSPLKAFDGGFQFSFFVVLGIALLEKPVSALKPIRFLCTYVRPLGEAVIISLCAQVAAIPMQLTLYGYIPMLSLPMNLICCLLMPLVMTGGWLVLMIGEVCEGFAAVCAQMLSVCSDLVEWLSISAAQLDWGILRLPAPGKPLLLLFAVMMMLLSGIIRFGRRRRAAFVASSLMLALLYLPRFNPADRYVQIDVGQGDASLIRSGRHAVVVDVGPESSYDLLRYLRHEGLFVDAVILSHMDEDHAGALNTLLDSEIRIDRVIAAKGSKESAASVAVIDGLHRLEESGKKLEYVEKGDAFSAAGISFDVLSPDGTLSGSNERSLLVHAHIGNQSLLLAGDLPESCEPEIVPSCDVLKVAHHGSRYASSPEFLSMANPNVALISVGGSNRYGHPHQRVLSDLQSIDAQVYRTDESGCITVYLNGNDLDVETMFDASGRNVGRRTRIFRQSDDKGD